MKKRYLDRLNGVIPAMKAARDLQMTRLADGLSADCAELAQTLLSRAAAS